MSVVIELKKITICFNDYSLKQCLPVVKTALSINKNESGRIYNALRAKIYICSKKPLHVEGNTPKWMLIGPLIIIYFHFTVECRS